MQFYFILRMKKTIKRLLIGILIGMCVIGIAVVIVLALLISKFFEIPESEYVYESNLSNEMVRYTLIYEDSVLFLDIDPECEVEREKIKSSEFYAEMENGPEPLDPDGYVWKSCDKQSKRIMEIESVETDGDTSTYVLFYKSPGEKGSQYRETLIQTPDSIISGNLEGRRTSYQEMMEYFNAL